MSKNTLRQQIKDLQQEQCVRGIYTFIPGTKRTYEEVIQELVACDLRRQLAKSRRKKAFPKDLS